jgi:hypothetical protein
MFANGKWINSVLQDVLYVPDLHGNLLSVLHLTCRGAEVHFLREDCHVYDRRKSLILEGGLWNNLYIMKLQVIGPVTANIAIFDSHTMDITELPDHALTMRLTSSAASLDLWHHRLGHLHTNTVTHMADNKLMTGMTISDREAPSGPCEPCLKGKQTREVIRKVTTTCTEQVLGHVHTDICSPFPTPSYHGHKYFLTFINDFSHFAFVSPLQEKSKVSKLLKALISRAELETRLKVKALCSDGGGEYMVGHV